MADKETLGDGPGSGGDQDSGGSEDMVSMAMLNNAVETAVAKTVESFKPLITEAMEEQGKRTRQSQRDAIEDRVGSTVANALKELGISTAPASGNDDGSQREDPSKSDTDKATQAANVVATEMQAILEARGLDGSEPELAEWAKDNDGKPWFKSGASFEELADTLKARKSDAPVGGGEGGGGGAGQDLAKEYVKEMRALMDRKNKGEISHVDARAERAAIRKKYADLDVPIDQIGFGSPGFVSVAEGGTTSID